MRYTTELLQFVHFQVPIIKTRTLVSTTFPPSVAGTKKVANFPELVMKDMFNRHSGKLKLGILKSEFQKCLRQWQSGWAKFVTTEEA